MIRAPDCHIDAHVDEWTRVLNYPACHGGASAFCGCSRSKALAARYQAYDRAILALRFSAYQQRAAEALGEA